MAKGNSVQRHQAIVNKSIDAAVRAIGAGLSRNGGRLMPKMGEIIAELQALDALYQDANQGESEDGDTHSDD